MSLYLALFINWSSGDIEILKRKMEAGSLSKILVHHQGKDPDQSHQWTLYADLAGMAKEVHVVGLPDPLRTLSGETPGSVVAAILSMGETPRGY